MAAVLGVFEFPDPMAKLARRLRDRGFTDLETYSPVPSNELDLALDEKPSTVRLFTLIGGLLGVVTGYALTIWMANDWQLPVGGKPYSSIPPYTIIAFELTILFGGVLTVLGLFGIGRLYPRRLDASYSRRFSAEDFGLLVRCQDRDLSEIQDLMRAQGATEVTLVER